MRSKGIILLLFLAAAGAVLYATMHRQETAGGPPAAAPAGVPASGTAAAPVHISVAYGTEKEAFMRAAVAAFRAGHPEIEVELIAKGSFETAEAILDGSLKPTIWSPADTMVMGLADSDWRTKTGTPLFAASGEDAPQPLVLSPLVFVVWEDRADALLKAGKGKLTWKTIRTAVTSNRGWLAVGGKSDWGFVKLGHTDPTRSNSGLQALWLMTLEFYGNPASVGVDRLLRPDYQEFVAGIERGVTRFEPSTGTFMIDMVRFGPSKYDIALVYESSAIEQLGNAEGRWGNLRVYYPTTTVWSDHPAGVLATDWVTPPQRDAAHKLLAHLRGRATQEQALAFGFRPADPGVPLRTTDPQNPFTRLAGAGLKVDVPPAAKTPDPTVVRNLTMLWSRRFRGDHP
jgi:hypothetical protein